MIALIQRMRRAEDASASAVTGDIVAGLLALVCAERGDNEADKLLTKLLGYRVFSDAAGKINRKRPVQKPT